MKKIISSVLVGIVVLCVLLTSVCAENYYNNLSNDDLQPAQTKDYKQKFWDVDKTHWAFYAISELTDRGAINGYDDGSFKPQNTVTRAEWAKIMIQAAGLCANDYSVRFNDMNGHWATPYVNAASNYLTAFNDNSYRPNQAVTREDVTMAMVKLKGYNLNEVDYSVLSKFKDVASISNSMKVYVAIAVEKGLIGGFEDDTFRGQATLTRAQAATLLWRAFQFGNDNKTPASSSPSESYDTNNSTYQPENNVANENNTPTQSNTTLIVNDLNGRFWDTISQRAHMDIKKKNDIYKICIGWSSSAWETKEWYFDAKIDKETGNLVYQNGYEFNVISNDDGTTSYNLTNDTCEGAFVFSGDLLIWNDYSEDISEKCRFEKGDESYEQDYSHQYEAAANELEKYIASCMTVDTYESAAEKESRLSEQYNLALGTLLSCFGYKDSDELLEKLASVHNIALKLPESIRTISNEFSFSSCSANMRDTMLFVERIGRFYSECYDLSLKFSYDNTKFNAEYFSYFGLNLDSDRRPVQLIVSLFAQNYRDAEFARLLKEAYTVSGGKDSTGLEMYYGGYNLEIIIKPHSSGSKILISGQKGAKKENPNSVLNSLSYKNNMTQEDNNTQKPHNTEEKQSFTNNSVIDKNQEDKTSTEIYYYACYYAEYVVSENHEGSITAPSKELVLDSLEREENATLKGEIEFFEKTLTEYRGDYFLDSETGKYLYLQK